MARKGFGVGLSGLPRSGGKAKAPAAKTPKVGGTFSGKNVPPAPAAKPAKPQGGSFSTKRR